MKRFTLLKNIKWANTPEQVDFIIGESYNVESSDKDGVYVISEDGSSVYFENEEEVLEYFEVEHE